MSKGFFGSKGFFESMCPTPVISRRFGRLIHSEYVKERQIAPLHNYNIFKGRKNVKIKTNVKAGGIEGANHNQTVIRALKAKTEVKADAVGNGNGGGSSPQRSQSMARGLKVKTGIKAGPPDTPTVRD